MKKICLLCKEEKNVNDFHVRNGKPLARCKCCVNKINKDWYNQNIEKKIQYNKKWLENNKGKSKACKKQWAVNNKDKIKLYNNQWVENNKDKAKAYKRKYYYKNSEKMNEVSTEWRKKNKEKHVQNVIKSTKKRYKNDLLFRLANLVRNGIHRVTNAVKKDKKLRSLEYLGCSLEQFKSHIESLWKEGMTWDNHGEWHIDHKIPLSWFVKNSNNPWEANHYLNLQPLWADDNLKKGAAI